MWFRLALALGMSLRRAQLEVDSREFAEWQAFGRLEPFGGLRDDQRAGTVAAAAANPYRAKGLRGLGPADFFPELLPDDAAAERDRAAALKAKFDAALRRGRKRKV